MSNNYMSYIRARNGSMLALLKDVNTIDIVEKLNDPGSWNVSSTTPDPCPFVSGSGLVVIRDGEVYYTGVLKQIEETYDAHTRLYGWQAKGASDLDFLSRRICYPDPETGSTISKAHYTDSGPLGEVIKRLIDLNIGVDAITARKEALIGETVIGDYGEFVTVSLRFQNLLESIKPLLEAQNYSIRPVWSKIDEKVHFEIWGNVGRHQALLFSTELNSVMSLEYVDRCPEANFVLSGGEGELTSRSFANAVNDDSVSEWGRVEYFHDMRATSPEDLQADADLTLEEMSAETVGYNAEMATTHSVMSYKKDWNIGDTVGVAVHGRTLSARILQVETNISHETATVTPTIGTTRTGQLASIFSEIKKLRSDINQLQAVKN